MRPRIVLAIVPLLLVVGAVATLQRHRSPHPFRVAIEMDVSYGSHVSNLYDHFQPVGAKGDPLVIVIHGGGTSGSTRADRWATAFCRALAADGIEAWSVDYRGAPDAQWPAQVNDCCAAICHARKLGHREVFLLGLCVGGWFGCAAAREQRVEGIITIAAPLVTPDWDHRLRGRILGDVSPTDASPFHHLPPSEPPLLLIHGTDDETVPFTQAVSMQGRAEAADRDVSLLTLDGFRHNEPPERLVPASYPAIYRWLQDHSAALGIR